jgi:phenylacetate-CoA ligase
MPTLLHPEDHAFHRMVAAFEGEAEPWLAVSRALRDALVAYAEKRCPYYKEVGGGRFEDLPLLTKEIIRERGADLVAEGVHRDRWAPDRTSGSLGPPVSFIRDTAQGALENVSALRFLRWMEGIPPDATRVWMTSAPPPERPTRRLQGRRRREPHLHTVALQTLTPARLRGEARIWGSFRAYFLYGHASTLGWIAEQVERGEVDLAKAPLCLVSTADTLTDHAARRLERILGAPVHSWYGAREVNGFVAGTLAGSRRYVFNPFLVHAEFLDDDGRPVPPGRPGRVIITDLNNLVMPFIRYDMGDVAVLSEERSVGGFPLVERLVGRAVEMLRFPTGRVLNGITLGRVLFLVNRFDDDIAAYQCAMTGHNELELRVIWARPATPDVRTAVEDAVKTVTDPDTRVTVVDIRELGRLPSGKAWILRDETVAV